MGNKSQGCWKGREPRPEGEATRRVALVGAEGVPGVPQGPGGSRDRPAAAEGRSGCSDAGPGPHPEGVPVLHAAGSSACYWFAAKYVSRIASPEAGGLAPV